MGIAQASLAAGGNHQLLTVVDQIPQQQISAQIAHFGAAGNADQQRVGAGSGGAVRPAAATIVGLKQAFVFEIQQGLQVAVGLQHHITTAAAIAAGGSASGHVFLAPKGANAITTAAGLDGNPGLVDELHGSLVNPSFFPVRPTSIKSGIR